MTHLKEGDKAPAFTATDQNGNQVSLKDFKGQKVVLYFYPADMTPTCTVQACNLRAYSSALKKEGYTVSGLSPLTSAKHKKFESKYNLPFLLIPDTDNSIINLY